MMDDLDLKDRKILFELEFNARQSDTQLAKKLRLSREVVSYRLKKLEEKRIIVKYHAIVNSMNLGKLMYRTYLKLQRTTPEKELEINQYLLKRFNWVTKVRGPWDIATMIFVRNNYEFDQIMKDVLSKFGEYIGDYWFAIMTKLHHCKRNYLSNTNDNTDIILQKTDHQTTLDDLDYKLIAHLTEFGREKYLEIARKFNVNEKLIRNRMKRLIDNKIILGFTPFLNIPLLGRKYYKLHFTLHNKSRDTIKRIIGYSIAHKDIIYIVEGTGCADIELELQVPSTTELYSIIDEFRNQFKDAIRDNNFMEYTKEYKFEYVGQFTI